MKKEIEEQFNKFIENALPKFLEDQEPPFIFLFLLETDNKILLVPCVAPFNMLNSGVRQKALHTIGGLVAKDEIIRHKIIAGIVASEAWYTEHDKNTDIKNVPMPSQDQNKKEAICFALQTKDGEHLLRLYQIIRINQKKMAVTPKDDMAKMEDRLLGSFWCGFNEMSKNITLPSKPASD